MATISLTSHTGTTSSGRPVVYWSDGSWSYADTLPSQATQTALANQGIDWTTQPSIIHYTGDINQTNPGSSTANPAYTVGTNGQKSYVDPNLQGGNYNQNAGNGPFSPGQQWNPQTGQFEKQTDTGLAIATGLAAGGLGAGVINAALAGGAAGAGSGAGAVSDATAGGSVPAGAGGALSSAIDPATVNIPDLSSPFASGAINPADVNIPDLSSPYTTGAINPADVNTPNLAGGGVGAAAAASTGIPWQKILGPLIGGAAGITQAVLGSNAAKTAAAQQVAAEQQAAGVLGNLYGQAQQRYAPYQASGQAALGSLNNLLGLNTAGIKTV